MEKKCEYCGRLFKKKNNESLKDWKHRHKYCCKECSNKAKIGKPNNSSTKFKKGQTSWNKGNKGYNSGNKNPKWKGGQIIKYCLICKKEFKVDQYRKDTARFCSMECKHLWMKGKHFSLETEFQSIPDELKSINSSIRNTKKYITWRKQVFQRDNFTCQECGAKTIKGSRVYLNAHHIKQFSLLLKENNIERTKDALKCDILWELSNGITLCKECHILEHSLLKN